MRALAAEIFVVDAAASQVALGQAGQAVRLVHFEHIALQHGVVHIALHFDAMVGKHMAVVLDVLAELVPGRVFQPGFEAGQHRVERQLLRCVRAGVAQRDVGGLTGRHAEADADDFGTHLVQRGGLGVQRHQLGGLDARQPGVEGVPGQEGVVARRGATGAGVRTGFGRVRARIVEQTWRRLPLGLGRPSGLAWRWRASPERPPRRPGPWPAP